MQLEIISMLEIRDFEISSAIIFYKGRMYPCGTTFDLRSTSLQRCKMVRKIVTKK